MLTGKFATELSTASVLIFWKDGQSVEHKPRGRSQNKTTFLQPSPVLQVPPSKPPERKLETASGFCRIYQKVFRSVKEGQKCEFSEDASESYNTVDYRNMGVMGIFSSKLGSHAEGRSADQQRFICEAMHYWARPGRCMAVALDTMGAPMSSITGFLGRPTLRALIRLVLAWWHN